MSDFQFNLGILLGMAAAVISVLATLAALYLWAVKRAKTKFDKLENAQSRLVLPWLSPLLLPTLIIVCLGLIAGQSKAYEKRSWPDPSLAVMIGAAFMILVFWLKLHKHTKKLPLHIARQNEEARSHGKRQPPCPKTHRQDH
jgi:hypothetical protein